MRNADFADVLEGWRPWSTSGEPLEVETVAVDGRHALQFEVSLDPPPAWGTPLSGITQVIQAEPNTVLEVRFALKAEDVRNGWGVFGEAALVDAEGGRIAEERTSGILADGVWQEPVLRVRVPGNTGEVRVSVNLQGLGRVWAGGVSARVVDRLDTEPPEGSVTVEFIDTPLEGRFLGFGFEDDGFIYGPVNRAKGVTDADIELRERRIRWLAPDLVRTKVWFGGWWPEGPAAPRTFAFDAEYMQMLYRTLEFYQELGAAVNITCVEWGIPVFDDLDATAYAIGELFEELVHRRGYTCIEYWTLANEPDITVLNRPGLTFDVLTRAHDLVRGEFARRGLDIKVIGSDDADNMGLFERCVQTPAYDATVDVYASHIYPRSLGRMGISFKIDQRLDLLKSGKPFILAEFGFLDERADTFSNPFMDTYNNALYTADLGIRALNLGVRSLSIWTVQEMYYHGRDKEGRLMACGLWAFKDRDWMVKPVYHAYGMFTRLTSAGDPVYPGRTSAPGWAQSVRVGNHAFFTNEMPREAEVAVRGHAIETVRVYDESISFNTETECGRLVTAEDGVFTLPPRSFAWAVLP